MGWAEILASLDGWHRNARCWHPRCRERCLQICVADLESYSLSYFLEIPAETWGQPHEDVAVGYVRRILFYAGRRGEMP